MADFSVNVLLAAPDVQTQAWSDPATASAPSRLNPAAGRPHLYWRVVAGNTIEFRAVVGGVEAPADAALGGRLINWAWVEGCYEGLFSPPAIVSPVGGKTSIAQVAIPSSGSGSLGHFTIQAWRSAGGAVLVPFMVISAP